jgi:hypothetical protein
MVKYTEEQIRFVMDRAGQMGSGRLTELFRERFGDGFGPNTAKYILAYWGKDRRYA